MRPRELNANNNIRRKQRNLRNDRRPDGTHNPPGQITTTTPYGRDSALTGTELDASKLIAQIDGAAYVKRASLVVSEIPNPRGKVYTIKNLLDAKKTVENAFKVQALGGFAFVELLSTCSVNWKMSVLEAKRHVNEQVIKRFPLGVYRDTYGVEKA